MADNTTLNSGTGGDVIASDDIAGVKHQRVKISIGADGAAADCSSANPLPVQLSASTATTEVVGDAAHDAAAAGNPVLVGGYASAAAPSDVSADGDAVRAWMLRNGAQATVITAAGALVGGDATNGIDVDVTRVIPGTSATHLGKAVDSAAGATDTGVAALFVRDDALTTLTPADGDYVPGRVDSTGNLHVRVSAGGVAGVANDAALTIGTSEGVPVMGRASTATPSAVSADNDAVHAWMTREGATVVAGAIVDDAAFTPGTSRVQPIAFQADEGSTDSVDEGDAGCPRMTLDRKVITTPYVHSAAGGSTPHKNLDVDETEDAIKASAGKLFWLHVINLANAKRYIKLYDDTVANVSVGTTVPVLTFPIPTMGDTNGAGFAINLGDHGAQFANAITVAATTGFADNDTGAPGGNEIILNCGYA